MSLRLYLIIMTVATFICWSAFSYILYSVNPEVTNWVGFMLFYVSLFMALVGTLALIGFIIRFIGLKRDFLIHSVKTAFRQAFLFAFFIIAGLFMLAHNLFSWFNLIILIIALSLLEFFLLSYKKSINQMDESNITLPAMESEKKEQ